MVFSAGISQRKKTKEITRKSDLGKESVSPLLSQAQKCQAGRHWPRAGTGHVLVVMVCFVQETRHGAVCPCLVTNPLPPRRHLFLCQEPRVEFPDGWDGRWGQNIGLSPSSL